MKNLLNHVLLFLIGITSGTTLLAQCPVEAPPDITVCGGSTTLTASTNFVTYSVQAVSCSTVSLTSPTTAFNTACDDCVTGQIPIGFNFNFYGNVYSTAVIQSNGIVGFGNFTFTGYSPFTIPTPNLPNNYIAGLFADIDIRYGGTITYQTVGTAPNRRFVVSYQNVVAYGNTGPGAPTISFQIILNENGSFNVAVSQLSANWYSTTSGYVITSGAENIDGSIAFPVPGRNSTDIGAITQANQDCHLFNPNPCTFIDWRLGSTVLSTNTSLVVSPTSTTTYTARWNCNGTICTDNTTVTYSVTQAPTVTSPSICQGAPVPQVTASAGAGTGTGTQDYRWFNASGNHLGNGSNFNPTSFPTTSGLPNSNSPGTYTFYVSRSDNSNINNACKTPFTYTVNTVLGDTSIYGDNTWNVYAFNNNTSSSVVNGNYYGYYSQSLPFTTPANLPALPSQLGVDTDATGYWPQTSNPSTATGYQGCALTSNDNFAFSHKRRGFPCGTYQFTMNDWDDATSIYINGVQIWSCTSTSAVTGCPAARPANTPSVLGIYSLNANSKVEVRTIEGTGNSRANLSITPIVDALASNNNSRVCPVIGNQWTHFYTEGTGRYLGSVRGTTVSSNLGNVSMTVYDNGSPINVPACLNAAYITSVLERHWLINPTIQGAAEVLLPYYTKEFNDLMSAANANTNLDDNVSTMAGLKLSKYSGGASNINENGIATDNCVAAGGTGGTTIWTSSGTGSSSITFPAAEMGTNYSTFLIPGFSEFWLHGMDPTSPLSINLKEFSAVCENSFADFTWTTLAELDAAHFLIEQSRDGINWNEIGRVNATGTSNSENIYKYSTQSYGDTYYRLIEVDINNERTQYAITQLTCDGATSGMLVYPNPTTGIFQVNINSEEQLQQAELTFTDINGKTISSQQLKINSGVTQYNIDQSGVAPGIYFVKLTADGKEKFKPVKLIIK